MCGTAINKSEYGHGHFRVVQTTDTAAYEYLTKEASVKETIACKTAAAAERKKPSDSLSVGTAVMKRAVDKCTSLFAEIQKSPAYK